jgi:hypothetical protein
MYKKKRLPNANAVLLVTSGRAAILPAPMFSCDGGSIFFAAMMIARSAENPAIPKSANDSL